MQKFSENHVLRNAIRKKTFKHTLPPAPNSAL